MCKGERSAYSWQLNSLHHEINTSLGLGIRYRSRKRKRKFHTRNQFSCYGEFIIMKSLYRVLIGKPTFERHVTDGEESNCDTRSMRKHATMHSVTVIVTNRVNQNQQTETKNAAPLLHNWRRLLNSTRCVERKRDGETEKKERFRPPFRDVTTACGTRRQTYLQGARVNRPQRHNAGCANKIPRAWVETSENYSSGSYIYFVCVHCVVRRAVQT